MGSTELFHNLGKHHLKTTITSALLDAKISAPTSEIFVNNLLDTIDNVKKELNIRIPLDLSVPNVMEWSPLFDGTNNRNKVAFFEPVIDNLNRTTMGKIYFNMVSIRSQAIQMGNENNRTSWESIRDLAHELRHAYQFENDTPSALEDGKNPYNAQFREYDAELFAFNYIKKQPAKNIVDWGDKQILLLEIRSHLKEIKAERKKLGLN